VVSPPPQIGTPRLRIAASEAPAARAGAITSRSRSGTQPRSTTLSPRAESMIACPAGTMTVSPAAKGGHPAGTREPPRPGHKVQHVRAVNRRQRGVTGGGAGSYATLTVGGFRSQARISLCTILAGWVQSLSVGSVTLLKSMCQTVLCSTETRAGTNQSSVQWSGLAPTPIPKSERMRMGSSMLRFTE
jgi:hypothetical protein